MRITGGVDGDLYNCWIHKSNKIKLFPMYIWSFKHPYLHHQIHFMNQKKKCWTKMRFVDADSLFTNSKNTFSKP